MCACKGKKAEEAGDDSEAEDELGEAESRRGGDGVLVVHKPDKKTKIPGGLKESGKYQIKVAGGGGAGGPGGRRLLTKEGTGVGGFFSALMASGSFTMMQVPPSPPRLSAFGCSCGEWGGNDCAFLPQLYRQAPSKKKTTTSARPPMPVGAACAMPWWCDSPPAPRAPRSPATG